MTKEEARIEMLADGLKPVKDYRGKKVLEPRYNQMMYIGLPMYAVGDGSPDGWEIARGKEGYKIYLYQLKEKAKERRRRKHGTSSDRN